MAPSLPNLPAREALLADFRHAHALAAEGQRAAALDLAKRIDAAVAGMAVRSSAVLLSLAVLSDELGQLEQALTYIITAVGEDPLCLNTENSFGIIIRRVLKKLTTEAWDDVSPRLYETLAANGLADAACHVAWAAYLNATGRNEEALEVARSVTLLNPRCQNAWQMVEVAALALGRGAVAQDAASRYLVAGREDLADGWNHVKWGAA